MNQNPKKSDPENRTYSHK